MKCPDAYSKSHLVPQGVPLKLPLVGASVCAPPSLLHLTTGHVGAGCPHPPSGATLRKGLGEQGSPARTRASAPTCSLIQDGASLANVLRCVASPGG